MPKLTFWLCTLALFLIPMTSHADLSSYVKAYQKAGTSIVDMTNSGNVDTSVVREKVLELTKQSVEIAKMYTEKHHEGKALLQEVIQAVAKLNSSGQVEALGPMVELSFQEIEDKWHDLGHFESDSKGVDLEDEDNEHFTDPLHVMVHPIMVLRAAIDFANTGDKELLKTMKEEMEEGLEQVELTVTSMQS